MPLTFSTVYIRNLNNLNNSSAKNVLQSAVRIALSYAPRSGLSINRGMSAVRCATNREATDAPNDWPVFRTDYCSKPRPRLPIFAAGRLETSQWCDAIRPLRFMMQGEAGFTGSTARLADGPPRGPPTFAETDVRLYRRLAASARQLTRTLCDSHSIQTKLSR